MAEEEKKKHAGDDFEKSIRNVMDAQKSDFSKNFPKSKKLPGIVRSLQEKPFKLMLGNYDQLRLGAEYPTTLKAEWNYYYSSSSSELLRISKIRELLNYGDGWTIMHTKDIT